VVFQAEGIFRINAENSHHEHVRDKLNKGVVPMDIDLHCLAGLIKVVTCSVAIADAFWMTNGGVVLKLFFVWGIYAGLV
jgi:hypothetical protein